MNSKDILDTKHPGTIDAHLPLSPIFSSVPPIENGNLRSSPVSWASLEDASEHNLLTQLKASAVLSIIIIMYSL